MTDPHHPTIDLRSDTVTRPSEAMRSAMAAAEVGDDVLDGDPTTRRLEASVAEMLGQESALFFPSGTQANQTAVRVLTTPGTELLLEAGAHLIHYEKAAVAALSAVQIRPIAAEGGVLTSDLVAGALRPDSPHLPRVSAIAVENTHNAAGGKILPLENLREIRKVAERHDLPLHMDGARLWNAAAGANLGPGEFSVHATTVMVSFSKGLGCPVGSCLAGPRDLIEQAWHVRKLLGGGMRQSGVLAAACIYALEHNLPRIGDDNALASLFAGLLRGIPGIQVEEPDTNIVMIDLASVDSLTMIERLAAMGVLLVPFGRNRLRAVTHADVDEEDVRRAARVISEQVDEA